MAAEDGKAARGAGVAEQALLMFTVITNKMSISTETSGESKVYESVCWK